MPPNITVATVPKPGVTSSRPAFEEKEENKAREREGGEREITEESEI